ncbi:hypothetical protein [Propionivibrio soli]|uniref:hypothetical protein n=1 Tax=Propionivibrio soli TaxID=2976531 RepID=UPI0021E88F72|nr:hypothetical protein [Propionivibrio soli]
MPNLAVERTSREKPRETGQLKRQPFMASTTERTAVWDAMLEADYQRRYWHAKGASFVFLDRCSQIALAVLSSAAVLSALGDLKLLDIWKWLSAITAVIATALPFMSYTRRSVAMTDLSARWHALEIEYSSIWREIDKVEFSEPKFKKLKETEVELGRMTSDLPTDDKKLQRECYEQVLISRGIKNGSN